MKAGVMGREVGPTSLPEQQAPLKPDSNARGNLSEEEVHFVLFCLFLGRTQLGHTPSRLGLLRTEPRLATCKTTTGPTTMLPLDP